MDIHDGKRSLYCPHSQGRKPLPLELNLIRILSPNSNPDPKPILDVATVKRTFTFTTVLTTGMPLTAVS